MPEEKLERKPNATAYLVLEDGTIWSGQAHGAIVTGLGEVVFNTSMTGYQEIITDPSYRGQIVIMTASHIGNVGMNPDDEESERPWLSGLVARAISPVASNWRAKETLSPYLARHGIPAISGVDTRALTLHIREKGAMRAAISTDPNASLVSLRRQVQAWPGLDGRDLVQEVTTVAPYTWQAGSGTWELLADSQGAHQLPDITDRVHVIVYDFGVKRNILRRLAAHGARLTVVPANTPVEQVLSLRPDGIFLSNGPGDPAALSYAAGAVAELLTHDIPLFGICLGHQILALATGAETYKMKFGHHGGNQPVKDALSGRVQITAQNHSYAVAADSLPPEIKVTHWNLNDGTVEGMQLRNKPVFSVQYHPEASPGPHDADYFFEQFIQAIRHAG